MAGSKKRDAASVGVAPPRDAVIAEAKAALAAEKADRAIALLTRAIAADPKNAALFHARGAVHAIRTKEWPSWKDEFNARRKASFALAAKDFDAAIKLAPTYAEAYLSRGLARQHLDGKGARADFGRALELGLLPTCSLQAYSARSEGSDLTIVNTMRKTRGIGNDWRDDTPQLVTIRSAVPAPVALAVGRPTAKAPRTKSSGEVDWAALQARVDVARKAAIKDAARGVAVKPDEVARDIWLSGFPAEVRPGVHVFLDPPANVANKHWKLAVEAVGKKNELALAKAIVGRRSPPFFYSPQYILQAMSVLAGDAAWLAACAHGFLLEVVRMDNFRYGMEDTIAALRKVVPTDTLLPESVTLIEKLSASKKYKQIAQALRDWAGLAGKPSAKRKAEVAANELAAHAKAVEAFERIVIEATTKDDVPRLRALHKQLEKLDLLVAGDHPAHRRTINAGIARLRKRATKAPEAASRILQNMLDAATDS